MRTLILGGTGMLGRALTFEGRRRGFAVLALSHSQADVRDRSRLFHWMDEFRPELVINAAAYTKVDLCETERELALAVNGEAVGNVAAAAGRVRARLLHVSTDYVFDGSASSPYQEDAPAAPISVYGESKLLGERALAESDNALVVRTSWLFGPGGPNFVATMVGLIERGAVPLRVVDDQEGCPTHTGSLARALFDLAPLSVTGVMHYRDREPVTWYSFAREIARIWSGQVEVVPIKTADMPRPARRPAYSVLDVSRFEAAVGRPVEPWHLGLCETLKWMRTGRM
ncbi:MAG TPA: dTDP-4-dehydrorhamnose reductase [Thermoanaerobaculia bacterium]|nr:dTDP-4-dehydrorhamnose reductase [Thermoanaerobaculia bacterium]